jgi:hypothetical protein
MTFLEAVDAAIAVVLDEAKLSGIVQGIKILAENAELSLVMLRELLNKAKLGQLTKIDVQGTIKKHMPQLAQGSPEYQDVLDGLESALQSYGKMPLSV